MSGVPEAVRRGLWTGLIFSVCLLAFSRCFDYGLVNLDDYGYILGHPLVVNFSGWRSLVACFSDVSEAIWMPLTWLSYALDWRLFGTWYGGFHLHSVVVHAVNAVLVWCLLRLLMTDETPRGHYSPIGDVVCLLAALVWAVHPLRCESVVFLASRKDVSSFFWELLALIAWVRGSQCDGQRRRVRLTAVSVIFFVVGAMCKPSVMTFPLLCLILDVFVLRRVRPLRYLIPVVLMIGLGLFAAWQQSVGGAMADGAGEPLYARLAVAMAAFGIYIRNTVLPFWLAAQCVKQWPDWPRFLIPGMIISLAWGGFLLLRFRTCWERRREIVSVDWQEGFPICLTFKMSADYVMAGMAWFVLAIAPMLGIASFGYHAYADRFTYIPSFGLVLMLAVGLQALVRRFDMMKVNLPMIGVLLALMFVTWWQTGFWRDDLTLFTRTLEIDGERNDAAHSCLALYYYDVHHDLEKAREHFEKTKAVKEDSLSDVIAIYVLTLVEMGREDEARKVLKDYEEALIRHFGARKAMPIIKSAFVLSPRDSKISMPIQFAKIALCLGKNPSLDDAKENLMLYRDSQETSGLWQYLAWRYLTLSGEKDAADAMLERLLNPEIKNDYAQFRFLRSVRRH